MMEEKQLKISEMTKKVGVEAHVLRYWEEELDLPIKRNSLGHRYYTQEDVERFLQIKGWKGKGIQLKGIKSILQLSSEEGSDEVENYTPATEKKTFLLKMPASEYGVSQYSPEKEKDDKSYRLQMLLKGLVKEAVQESNAEMAMDIKDSIIKEMDYQFRMIAEEQEKQQRCHQKQQEEYFEKLDYMITDRLQMKKKKRIVLFRNGERAKPQ